jgi:hypothetical protein
MYECSVVLDVSKQGIEKKYTREKFTGRNKNYVKRSYAMFYQLHNILKITKCRKVA